MPINSNFPQAIAPEASVGAAATVLPAPANDGLVQRLQDRICRVETGRRSGGVATISSGCEAIDRLLPGQGYSPGTIVQWLSAGGQAADYLSLLTAIEACRGGRALVVLDPWYQFYPPAVAKLGFDMVNLIVLRPGEEVIAQRANPAKAQKTPEQAERENNFYWSVDQSLRCPAVGAVWGPLGTIDERWFRRFQLSAEVGGGLGLFLQSLAAAKQPSWAEVQWLVQRPKSVSEKSAGHCQQRVRLVLNRCRRARTGQAVEVTIDTVSGTVG